MQRPNRRALARLGEVLSCYAAGYRTGDAGHPLPVTLPHDALRRRAYRLGHTDATIARAASLARLTRAFHTTGGIRV